MMLGFSNSTCTAIYTEQRFEWKGNKTNPSVWIYLVPASLKRSVHLCKYSQIKRINTVWFLDIFVTISSFYKVYAKNDLGNIK